MPVIAPANVRLPIVTQTGRGDQAQVPPYVDRSASVSALVAVSTSRCLFTDWILRLYEMPVFKSSTRIVLPFLVSPLIVDISTASALLLTVELNKSDLIKPSVSLCLTFDHPLEL